MKTVIEMAKEAGDDWDSTLSTDKQFLERFAELVRADERNRTWTKEHWTEYEHSIVAGALFDFMGWLTSRKERIVLSSSDNASPAVEAITEFAKMRGLSLDDAKVQDWQDSLRSNT